MKELVWAKIVGYRTPCPAFVVQNPPEYILKRKDPTKDLKCVYFFHIGGFHWIEDDNWKEYTEYKDTLSTMFKKVKWVQEAVRRCDEYIKDPIKYKANAEPKDDDLLPPVPTQDELEEIANSDMPIVLLRKTDTESNIFN